MMAKFWISLLICACWMLQSHASVVVVTPDKNSTVYYDSSENVTYSCVVEDGEPVWEITCLGSGCISLQLRTNELKYESKDWLVVDVAENQSTLMVREEARRKGNMRIVCLSHSTDSTVLIPPVSKDYYITTYGPLEDPSKLELTVDSNNRHFFKWISPRVPQDVILSCYVTAVNLSSGNTLKNISTTEQYVSVLNSSRLICSEVMLSVFCANEEDDRVRSNVSTKIENIPLSTNVSNISQTLTIESVNLNQGGGIEVQISFLPVRSCSRNFPVISYTVLVKNDLNELLEEIRLDYDADFLLSPPLDEKVFITLNKTIVPSLRENAVYRVSVNVCSDVTCRESESQPIYTTDVQNVKVYFFENNVFVECSFAANSLSRGCLVRLVLDGNETMADELVLSRDPSSVSTLSQCNTTANQRSAYDVLFGLDLESNGTEGSVPIPVIEMEPIMSAREFTELTGCSTSGPNVVAIAVPIIIVLFLLFTIIGVIVFIATHYKQRRKIKKIKKSKTQMIQDKKDPQTYVCEIDHDTADLICSETPEVPRSRSAPSVTSMAVSNGESTAQLVPTKTERKQILYKRSVSDGGEKVQTAPVEVFIDRNNIRLKVNRPALRSAARKRSRPRSDGSALSSDSEESTSLIPPVSLEVKFSDQLQRDMMSGGLSPLPEEVEESAEERKKDEDVDGAIVFESHELQTDEQSNQVNAVDIVDVKTAV